MSERPSTRFRVLLAIVVTTAVVGLIAVVVAGLNRDDPEPTAAESDSTSAPATDPESGPESGPESDPESDSGSALESESSTETPDSQATSGDPAATTSTEEDTASPSAEPEPGVVLDQYLSAYFGGKCQVADAKVSKEYLKREGSCADDPDAGDSSVTWKVKPEEFAKDGRARVPVVVSFSDFRQTLEFELVIEDGGWKVDRRPA